MRELFLHSDVPPAYRSFIYKIRVRWPEDAISIAERVTFADWWLVNLLNGVSREGTTLRTSISSKWDTNDSFFFFFCIFQKDKCEKSDFAHSPSLPSQEATSASQTVIRFIRSADINVVIFYDTVTINKTVITCIIIEMYCKPKIFYFGGKKAAAMQVRARGRLPLFAIVNISCLIFTFVKRIRNFHVLIITFWKPWMSHSLKYPFHNSDFVGIRTQQWRASFVFLACDRNLINIKVLMQI